MQMYLQKRNIVFKGRSTTPTGEVEYTDGASYTATSNVTLYAVWAAKYKVGFSAFVGSLRVTDEDGNSISGW